MEPFLSGSVPDLKLDDSIFQTTFLLESSDSSSSSSRERKTEYGKTKGWTGRRCGKRHQ